MKVRKRIFPDSCVWCKTCDVLTLLGMDLAPDDVLLVGEKTPIEAPKQTWIIQQIYLL